MGISLPSQPFKKPRQSNSELNSYLSEKKLGEYGQGATYSSNTRHQAIIEEEGYGS